MESHAKYGGGGEISYVYVKDSGLGVQVNIGGFLYPRTLFAPIVISYYFYPDRKMTPFIGAGIWGGEAGGGTNLLLNAGVFVSLNKNIKLNLDVKEFSKKYNHAIAFNIGIIRMLN